MERKSDNGRSASVNLNSYTYLLLLGAGYLLFSFIRNDLGEQGKGYIRIAYGLQSNTWIWACAIGNWLAAAFPNQMVAGLYTRYTGLRPYVDDRIGYAKSGGLDVARWSGFLTMVVLLYLFAVWVPPGRLWGLRSLSLIIATAVIGGRIALFFASKIFFALYGPPRFPSV